MNSSSTANCRFLSLAISLAPVAIAALWAMPRNAQADIYVANHPKDSTGVVSKYDDNGVEIKARFIEGLNSSVAIAVDRDLFVADADSGTVGKYDANTGAVINGGFITGLKSPSAVAVSGNALFVLEGSGDFDGAVAEYDSTTGKLLKDNILKLDINADSPTALAVDSSGNYLFVPCSLFVFQYNIGTGQGGIGYTLGIDTSVGFTVASGRLFETNTGAGVLDVYSEGSPDASVAMARLNEPTYLAALRGTILIVNFGSGKVATHDSGRQAPDNYDFITGLNEPSGIAVRKPTLKKKKIVFQVPR
jgi:hypothetical protein